MGIVKNHFKRVDGNVITTTKKEFRGFCTYLSSVVNNPYTLNIGDLEFNGDKIKHGKYTYVICSLDYWVTRMWGILKETGKFTLEGKEYNVIMIVKNMRKN